MFCVTQFLWQDTIAYYLYRPTYQQFMLLFLDSWHMCEDWCMVGVRIPSLIQLQLSYTCTCMLLVRSCWVLNGVECSILPTRHSLCTWQIWWRLAIRWLSLVGCHARILVSEIGNELFCAFVAVQRGPHYEDVGSPKYSEVIWSYTDREAAIPCYGVCQWRYEWLSFLEITYKSQRIHLGFS